MTDGNHFLIHHQPNPSVSTIAGFSTLAVFLAAFHLIE
jgi:hypothetical protein